MILKITNSDSNFGINVFVMTINDFKMKEHHPFIAASKWERIEVDLCEELPGGILNQIVSNVEIVPVFDMKNITPKIIALLSEICVNDRARIRFTATREPDKLVELLESLGERYEWNKALR